MRITKARKHESYCVRISCFRVFVIPFFLLCALSPLREALFSSIIAGRNICVSSVFHPWLLNFLAISLAFQGLFLMLL